MYLNHSFIEFHKIYSLNPSSKHHHIDLSRLDVDSFLVKHNQLIRMSVQNFGPTQNLTLSILLHKVKVLILAHYHTLDFEFIFVGWSNWLVWFILCWFFWNQVFSQLQLNLFNDTIYFFLCWLILLLVWILLRLFLNGSINYRFDCWRNWCSHMTFLIFFDDWVEFFGLWNPIR